MDIETAYQQALDYLYSFVDYSLTRAFRYSPEKFDLTRMKKLLERLDNPHLKYKVIHLAGTKGKGSTASMIANALVSEGYKVGFYTSPHLVDFTERIQVNGHLIPRQSFVNIVESLKPHVEFIKEVTTFELTTAVAFLYFVEQGVDIAVVEVGLGGRLDATNMVDPLVSVITSISYDHMAVLGNTLTSIATEKAGIIKEDHPVVVSPQKGEALRAIQKVAHEKNAPITLVGVDYLFKLEEHSLDGQTLLIWHNDKQSLMDRYLEHPESSVWQPTRLKIPLLGFHQLENAATAYAALMVARDHGLAIRDEAIAEGFATVFWPCRFEVMQREPLLIVDSAHNRDSALRLRLAIDDYLPGKPIVLLFGASEDKDVKGMFTELLPRTHFLIATESIHPRAFEASKLVEIAHQFGSQAKAVVPVELAIQEALALAEQENAVVVVAGSLFVAAAVREIWVKMGRSLQVFETAAV